MANRYSVTSGLASAASTWNGGATVPGSGDRVLIDHPGTATNTVTTNTAGYAISATDITLTGTVTAGNFSVGECVKFGADSNYYKISGWNNTTKVLTVAPLIVAIPASATTVTNYGHVVELDGTCEWGDDSASTITVNGISTTTSVFIRGTLRASRTANSQLTALGSVLIYGGNNQVQGTYDAGNTADPIALGVNHTLLLNKTGASPSMGKYGLTAASGVTGNPKLWLHGHYRRRNAVLIGAVAINATSAVVDDATGWQAGDAIIFAPTTSTTAVDERTISTITPGSGTTATITFSALTYAHMTGSPVGNFTSNIKVAPYDANYGSCVAAAGNVGLQYSGWGSSVHVENTRFEGIGGSAFGLTSAITFSTSGSAMTDGSILIDPIQSNAFYAINASTAVLNSPASGCLGTGGARQHYILSDNAFYVNTGVAAGCGLSPSSTSIFEIGAHTNVVYRAPLAGIASASALQSGELEFKLFGCGTVNITLSAPISVIISGNLAYRNLVIGPAGYRLIYGGTSAFNTRIINGDLGYTFGKGTATLLQSGATNAQSALTYVQCRQATGLTQLDQTQIPVDGTSVSIVDGNLDITKQEIYSNRGNIIRDNSVYSRSRTSIRLEPQASSQAISREISFVIPNGATVPIVGALRKNSSYGSSTRPYVKVTGLGITPVLFTMTNSVDTWEPFTLSVTNSSGADGSLTLTFYGQSANASALCYLDGIPSSPFVTWAQHYGYIYDPTNPVRTVDSIVQLTEAQAAALTGISYATGVLTISGTRSHSEFYDWMKWYEAQNLLSPILTSTDGVNYALAAGLTLSGALTGTANLTITGTFTLSGGTSTVPITHPAGAFVAISVSGIIADSRVQLYDETTDVELYNDVPGTSLSLNAEWTTDHTIRLRCAYVDGVTAKMPIEQSTLLTNTGATFLVSQSADTVYNALAIDGSACSEFTADYPDLEIDVADLDYVTTVQRIYAWACWAQTTEQGIALMFNAVQAQDTRNFINDVDVVDAHLDNVLDTPILIGGGYFSRSDGTTVISATSGSIQMDPSRAYSARDIASAVAELHQIHGLQTGSPLTVTATSRTAAAISQTIGTVGATVTVERT